MAESGVARAVARTRCRIIGSTLRTSLYRKTKDPVNRTCYMACFVNHSSLPKVAPNRNESSPKRACKSIFVRSRFGDTRKRSKTRLTPDLKRNAIVPAPDV